MVVAYKDLLHMRRILYYLFHVHSVPLSTKGFTLLTQQQIQDECLPYVRRLWRQGEVISDDSDNETSRRKSRRKKKAKAAPVKPARWDELYPMLGMARYYHGKDWLTDDVEGQAIKIQRLVFQCFNEAGIAKSYFSELMRDRTWYKPAFTSRRTSCHPTSEMASSRKAPLAHLSRLGGSWAT
ncbi:hypothetical protein DACRYDRAFT_21869 [Dacryopinax primogenitus]|uniref:Uncharacterized protein n=1 Tax=Dacryopinax primogenitus (strain DJM 731) TaxID=1858805 RepID=M5GD13_DACPD|nr:uncharacterized protein DACRYDRAFT_21869 [Dacryopinax primogenitus]EJU02088.1 hypothetical protein DACRYDRAFT_21869 [Dacryopinax primogenitus]